MALDKSALLELTEALRSADDGQLMRKLLLARIVAEPKPGAQEPGQPPSDRPLSLGQWAKETASIVERPDRARLRLGTTPCGRMPIWSRGVRRMRGIVVRSADTLL